MVIPCAGRGSGSEQVSAPQPGDFNGLRKARAWLPSAKVVRGLLAMGCQDGISNIWSRTFFWLVFLPFHTLTTLQRNTSTCPSYFPTQFTHHLQQPRKTTSKQPPKTRTTRNNHQKKNKKKHPPHKTTRKKTSSKKTPTFQFLFVAAPLCFRFPRPQRFLVYEHLAGGDVHRRLQRCAVENAGRPRKVAVWFLLVSLFCVFLLGFSWPPTHSPPPRTYAPTITHLPTNHLQPTTTFNLQSGSDPKYHEIILIYKTNCLGSTLV